MQERDCDLNSSINVVNISDRAGELMSAHRRPTLKQPTRGLTSFIEQRPRPYFPCSLVGQRHMKSQRCAQRVAPQALYEILAGKGNLVGW